jgi:hypothetical protein
MAALISFFFFFFFGKITTNQRINEIHVVLPEVPGVNANETRYLCLPTTCCSGGITFGVFNEDGPASEAR